MLESFRTRMIRLGSTQGNAYLRQSDMIINETFMRDPSFKRVCLTHAPSGIVRRHYDAKFFIHTYRSISGDTEDYYLQFRPHVRVPIGSYVDIPDDRGKMQRWLIVLVDDRPQFPLYYVLKCNWTLKWVYEGKVYKCLGVLRNQNSYNSGVWTDYITTSLQNQNKIWLPTTKYTQTINYGQRFLINDNGREIPLAWMASKVEDVQPIGLTKLTLTQELTILKEDCGKYGLAGWCSVCNNSTAKNNICKNCTIAEPKYIDAGLLMGDTELPETRVVCSGKDKTIRVGGGHKTFTAIDSDNDVSWNVSLYDNTALVCAIDINFNSDNLVVLSSGCQSEIMLRDVKVSKSKYYEICCANGENDILKISVANDVNDPNAIKLKCLQLYSMVGKTLRISTTGNESAGVDLEVIS